MELAVKQLLASVDPEAQILWRLQYTQLGHVGGNEIPENEFAVKSDRILLFPLPCLDLEFNDRMIAQVQDAWKVIMGPAVEDCEFLSFEDREPLEEPLAA